MPVFVLQAGELHDPTWAGRQKEQPEDVQAVTIFQVYSQKQPC